jgi:predicted GNAT family N-acyltransferase
MKKIIDQDYQISDDRSKLDLKIIHSFLNQSYWSKGIPFDLMKKSIDNSFCLGVYYKDTQVGFARVITDYSTSAFLGDVFIIEEYRGKGLSKHLMEFLINHPEFKTIRTWRLGTDDAHGLYSQFGFKVVEHPEKFMERKQKVW